MSVRCIGCMMGADNLPSRGRFVWSEVWSGEIVIESPTTFMSHQWWWWWWWWWRMN